VSLKVYSRCNVDFITSTSFVREEILDDWRATLVYVNWLRIVRSEAVYMSSAEVSGILGFNACVSERAKSSVVSYDSRA
jgi:hypothetical protein